MGLGYLEAEKAETDLLATLIEKHYPDLKEAAVTVNILMAEKRDEEGGVIDGPAIRLHGYPCNATIKINGFKDRAEGKMDATIIIDKTRWDAMTEDECAALMDHELYHLIVRRDGKTKAVLRDDLSRPKMHMRHHDHQFGWFDIIAERHADASQEIKQAKAFCDKRGQLYFGFLPFGAGRPPESLAEEAPRIADAGKKVDAPTETKAKRGRPKKSTAAADPGFGARNRLANMLLKRLKDAQINGNEAIGMSIIGSVSGISAATIDEFSALLAAKTVIEVDGFTTAIEEMPVATLVNIVRSSGVEPA